MSVLSFQKLSGDLSTDGKILDQLLKLNASASPDLVYYCKQLYPKSNFKLIERVWNTSEDNDAVWSGGLDPVFDLNGSFFGIFTITKHINAGNATQDDGSVKAYGVNSNDEKVIYIDTITTSTTFIGEMKAVFRRWGYVNLNIHFLGFQIEDYFAYHVLGGTGNHIKLRYAQVPVYDDNGNPYQSELLQTDQSFQVLSPKYFEGTKNGVKFYPQWDGSQFYYYDQPTTADYYYLYPAEVPKVTFNLSDFFNGTIEYARGNEPFEPFTGKVLTFDLEPSINYFRLRSYSQFYVQDENFEQVNVYPNYQGSGYWMTAQYLSYSSEKTFLIS